MRFLCLSLLVGLATGTNAQTRQAMLGECMLESGARIENCRLGYRSFGSLNKERTNAILIPTWFASRAEAWVPFLGPTGIVDTSGFYVVVVESLGAGTSSSPSNSDTQRGHAFPHVTVGDMVNASYRLAREHLQLPELYAVVGISLGGLQAFEWGVQYPSYARRIVPINGTPRQATYGRAMWELLSRATEDGLRGVASLDSTAVTLARFLVIAGSSPSAANRRIDSTYASYIAGQAQQLRSVDLYEWRWHQRAILTHDIARQFNGDLTRAAKAWRAKSLVVIAAQDHSIDPEPARAFARLIRADTLVVASAAGHGAIFGDSAAKAVIRQWLRSR